MDRIRKLLAMAKDTASPNEAAIAARQARAMMDKHQIEELDLTTVVDDDLGSDTFETGITQANTAVGRLAAAVSKLNDVNVQYTQGERGQMNLMFSGFLVDAVCATEMLTYLKTEMYRQAERNAWGRADRQAYRLGFASGVAQTVDDAVAEREQLKTATGTSLVSVKNQLVEERFGMRKYSKSKTRFTGDSSSYYDGKRQGRRTGLDRQVNGRGQGRIAS